jgi:ferredoxin
MALVGRLISRVADKVRGVPASPAPARAPAPAPARVAAAAPTPAQPAPVPSPTANRQPTQPPRPSGFAAAARKASETGLSTAATLRETVAEKHEDDEAEAAPVAAQAVPIVPAAVQVVGELHHDAEIRISAEGVPYHGPVDNESARARAAGKRLDIDRNECIGCGTCVEHIDTVFWLNGDEGKAYVLAQEGAMDAIQDAIDACPVTCISWQES